MISGQYQVQSLVSVNNDNKLFHPTNCDHPNCYCETIVEMLQFNW